MLKLDRYEILCLTSYVKGAYTLPKNNNYKKGIQAENKVVNILRRAGASVEQSPGSRGAADLHANFGSRKWEVQVKSGSNAPTSLSGKDLQRLNQTATKRGATPVLATVDDQGNVEFRSTRSGRKLNP
jgi:Holliday junction resolvase